MCTKGFLNYFSAIIEFLKVVFKGEIIKFSNNCDTFAIKESGGVKFKLWNFKRIIIIINYQNGSGKPKKILLISDEETDCTVKFVSRNLVT